jgi:Flp pilus assembly protein TadG
MLIAATRRLGASRRGSTLVESALVLGLFVQMIFGIMEAARFMYFYNWVSYAAREGTRYACVRGSSSTQPASASDIQTFIMNQAVTYDPSNVTVATTWLPNNSRGSTVAVKVSYAYHPLIGIIFPAAMSLSATSKMVISQ